MPGLAYEASFLAATKLHKWVKQGELPLFNVLPGGSAPKPGQIYWFLGLPCLVKSCPGSPGGEGGIEAALQLEGKAFGAGWGGQ